MGIRAYFESPTRLQYRYEVTSRYRKRVALSGTGGGGGGGGGGITNIAGPVWSRNYTVINLGYRSSGSHWPCSPAWAKSPHPLANIALLTILDLMCTSHNLQETQSSDYFVFEANMFDCDT
ncbi:hypothetical protein J6590_063942 [Homalodisca vitripennis]|nr:hypothetical protein J6590_063942 [Homalodisca vitripennis]